MKLLHKGLVLISVPLAFELFFAFGFSSLVDKAMEQLRAEVHAKQVIAKTELLEVLTTESCFMVALKRKSESDAVATQFKDIWKRIARTYTELTKIETEKKYKYNLQQIKSQLNGFLEKERLYLSRFADQYVEAGNIGRNRVSSSFMSWYRTRENSRDLNPTQRLINAQLRSVRQGPNLHEEISKQFKNFLLVAVLGDIILLACLAVFFGTSIERRLQSLMTTTRRLAKGEDLPEALDGRDELAKLDLLLHNTASQIIETQRFKRQLLGVVCHELKAPLSAVQMLLSLVTEDKSSMTDRAIAALNRATKSCNRLQIMVTELLDLEYMHSGKVKLKLVETHPAEVLEGAAEMVRAIAKDYQVELIVESCNAEAMLDPDRMIQVLVNLTSNAIKFSPAGERVIVGSNDLGDNIEFVVADHGPGIPEELHETIFEVFGHSEKAKNPKIKGTGMGLAISKSIVEAHGGNIRIVSKPGDCQFRISIPKQPVAINKNAVPASGNLDPVLPKKQFRIRDKGMILIGVPLLAQVLLFGTLTAFLYQANIQIDSQSHARKIAETSQSVLRNLDDSAILVFLCAGLPETPGLYKDQYKKIDAAVAEFKAVSTGNPARVAGAEAVASAAFKINKLQSELIELSKTTALSLDTVAESLVKNYINAWKEMSAAVDEVASREGQLESNGTESLEKIAEHLNHLLVFGLAVNFLCAIGLTVYLTKNITNRISQVQTNAERILLREELLPPVTGTDEIAFLDRAFHDAARSLKEEQELKRQLLAIASHELRSPLAAILMTLGTLSAGVLGELTPKASERIAQAEMGTERLVALINDILDIEKMEAGKFVLSLEDLSIRTVVERAVACVDPLSSKRKILVVNKVEDVQVKGEAERLIQVLVNLISNAIKFSDDGQTVLVSSRIKDGKDLLVEVKDSGRGIPVEMQERIFERFVASQEEDNRNGTGLGLPISKAIIEQHGGHIGFESRANQGSMFWFSLPLSVSQEKAKSQAQMKS